eukprot:scaffold432085_cov18-Prasinocladus_malaysianus.AAC.1
MQDFRRAGDMYAACARAIQLEACKFRSLARLYIESGGGYRGSAKRAGAKASHDCGIQMILSDR